MMKREEMHISSTRNIALDTVEMVLKNKYISSNAMAGQFLNVLMPGHTLRRPISIADVDRENETVTILFKQIGEGTKKLAACQSGVILDVVGPSGNGFPENVQKDSTVLLIGGGVGVPPLYYLGKTLAAQGVKVITILGFRSKDHVFYEEKFRELGETRIVTDDASFGEQGYVTDVLDKVEDFDCYYACGPLPMLRAITEKLADKQGFISLEERMGCGVGACFACVIPADTEKGYKKICSDGPVFAAGEVSL